MQNFSQTMCFMKEHYKNSPSNTYPIPLHALRVSENELSEQAKAEIEDALQFAKSKMLSFVAEQSKIFQTILAEQKTSNKKALSELSASVLSTESFVEQMEQLKHQAEQKSGQQIDGIYDKLIQAGQQHPPAQPVILQRTQQVSNVNANVLAAITGVYGSILNQGIIGPVDAVGHFVSNTAKSIAHAFSSIF